MAKKISDLISALESKEEEKFGEEKFQFQLPAETAYDGGKKIAELYAGQGGTYLDMRRLIGNLVDRMNASYLVENLRIEDVNSILEVRDRHTIPRVVLADLAAGIIERVQYEPRAPFEKMLVDVAMQIYQDVYDSMFDMVRDPNKIKEAAAGSSSREHPRGKGKDEKSSKEDSDRDGKSLEVFEHFRGGNIEAKIAAARIAHHFKGVEDRLKNVRSNMELKQLLGAKFYYDMIKDEGIRRQLLEQINNGANNLGDVFVYAVLMLHKDFFTFLEK